MKTDTITDIATGAWCVSPHRYGIVTISGNGEMRYQAYETSQLSSGIKEASRDFFRNVTVDKEAASLETIGVTAEDEMLAFAADVNEAYFSGTLSQHPELLDNPMRERWAELSDTDYFAAYLTNLLSEPVEDALNWSSVRIK